jgi:GDPmannose 4,6-dehydratase
LKTALITGITGQDGSYLAELLAEKGYRIVGTTRASAPEAPLLPARSELRTLDILDLERTSELFREVRPDEVYHLAGQSSVGASFADPVGTFQSVASGTLTLLESARAAERGVRLFLASSAEVFGDTGSGAADESTQFRPKSPYAAAKAAVAELAAAYRLSYGSFVCVGYLFNHESPRRPERFVTRKIVRGACEIALGRRRTLELGDLSVVRDWGWAPEYVEAMWRMLSLETPDDFVLATGEAHSLEHFVELAFASVGLDARDHVEHSAALHRPAEVQELRGNPERARAKLGWSANLRLAEVVRRMVEAEMALLTRA